MKDIRGKVIYVGKAKNLRRRLASYFRKNPGYWKVERLVEEIEDIEVILVHNEVESLVLENNLIKRYRPRYNAFLVGDKTGYPYLLLTREAYPRLVPYKRNMMNKPLKGLTEEDCDRRFGPYLGYRFQNELLSFVAEKFRLRVCDPMPARACLLYAMGKCSGPCEGRITEEAYARAVDAAVDFLAQRNTELIQQMKTHMLECAERLEYERAQRIKVQVEALELGMERQVVERDIAHDQDALYFGEGGVLVAEIKRGALVGVDLVELNSNGCTAEARQRFLLERYTRACPPELLLNPIENTAEIERALANAAGHPVRLIQAQNGPERALVELCELNYRYRLDDHQEERLPDPIEATACR
jgi:excinuclease ABC subunit C